MEITSAIATGSGMRSRAAQGTLEHARYALLRQQSLELQDGGAVQLHQFHQDRPECLLHRTEPGDARAALSARTRVR